MDHGGDWGRLGTALEDHRAVALALADLLTELGYEDAAALWRGTVTMRVLAEWDRDLSAGYRALRKALFMKLARH